MKIKKKALLSTNNPLLSVIITNKNAYKWLGKLFSSLFNQSFKDFEVIFVDNCSTDNSLDFISKNYPQVKIIKNKRDLGFAGANNVGAAAAKGKFLFFLNTDTYLEKNTVDQLAKAIKKGGAGKIYQLDIRYYDRSNLKNNPFAFGMDYFGYSIGDGNFFYADGAAFAIEKNIFIKLGGFDEKYYMYLEDMDLCWRARLIGITVKILPHVYVFHYGGGTSLATGGIRTIYATTVNRRYHAQKNNLRSLLKNYSLVNLIWTFPVSMGLAIGEGFFYLFRGSFSGFLALHKSIIWNIINIGDTLKERIKIQKMRSISDREILKICDKRISKFHSFFSHGISIVKN